MVPSRQRPDQSYELIAKQLCKLIEREEMSCQDLAKKNCNEHSADTGKMQPESSTSIKQPNWREKQAYIWKQEATHERKPQGRKRKNRNEEKDMCIAFKASNFTLQNIFRAFVDRNGRIFSQSEYSELSPRYPIWLVVSSHPLSFAYFPLLQSFLFFSVQLLSMCHAADVLESVLCSQSSALTSDR